MANATNAATWINQDSGNVEWGTPPAVIEAARKALGGVIQLDPFSSVKANELVRATKIFTKAEDGLRHPWYGTVWMNHPFSRQMNVVCIQKLIDEYDAGRVTEAVCITFASTSEKWFAPLFRFPMCFLSPRTNYYAPDGTKVRGVTKGSVVTYLGKNPKRFKEAFTGLGFFPVGIVVEEGVGVANDPVV